MIAVMRAAGLGHGREAVQAVGDDLGAAFERRARRSLRSSTLLNAFTRRRMILMRLAVVCRFDRRDERRLARRAAPGPPSRSPPR